MKIASENLPTWDISDLYSSLDDTRINIDI